MRLIPSSSALLHTIISIAALHKARRSNDNTNTKFVELIKTDGGPRATEPDRASATDTQTELSTIQEALLHKQYALKNIRNDLDSLNSQNIDATIASVLLLLWQDLIDSGTESWKYHLDAVKGIVPFGLYPLNLPTTKEQQYYSQEMQNNFEMTYAVYVTAILTHLHTTNCAADSKSSVQHSSETKNSTSPFSLLCLHWMPSNFTTGNHGLDVQLSSYASSRS